MTLIKLTSVTFLCCIVFDIVSPSLVFQKINDGPRYQYVRDSKGNTQLVDTWLTVDNIIEASRYDPNRNNIYHLFTRDNPTVSQPLLINNPSSLQMSNFNNVRRTIVLVHGWLESATSDLNTVLIPAFLAAEDVNIIVVDWSAGASAANYRVAILNTIASGEVVAAFINWINGETTSNPAQYHIVGHGFGGHQAGIIGRHVNGNIAYITGLDPALVGWVNHIERFDRNDGLYTEVIHTNYGINGYMADLGKVDFYPNGGISMPGCDSNACDHARSFHYFAESITTGGFTGRQCVNYFAAILGMCDMLPGRLHMGGLKPKIGSTGVYLLETNAAPPFSRG